MTYPYPGDPLDGLDATPAERLAYLRALDEADAEEAAGGPPGGGYEDPEPGPWDGFNAAAAQMDADARLDAQRLAEDVADQIPDRRPPSDEVKLQRAVDRIGSGTYTAPPQQPASGTCGPLDEHTGTCAARYHAADCPATIAGTAAVESVRSAEAWAAALRNHPPDPGTLGYSAEFAEPSDPLGGTDTWAGLLQPPGGPDPGLHERMLAVLADAEAAEPGPEPIPGGRMPDIAPLRTALGL